jgi:effector-binding domain-containing protein
MSAFPSPAARADDLPKADEILAKVDARMGDAAARKKLRTLVMRGTVEFPDWSTGEMKPEKGKFEEVWLAPDRVKQHVEWGKCWLDQGTTGAFLYCQDAVMGVVVREGDEQGPTLRLYGIERRASWKDLYASAEVVGVVPIDELGGRKHFELAMKPAIGDVETWYVDAETFDLAAVDTTIPDLAGGAIKGRFLFSDFRDVHGIRFPFRKAMHMGADTTDFPYTYESIEVDAEVKPEQVAPAPAVLAAVKDPSKRVQSVGADANECKLEEVAAQPALSIRVTIPAGDVSKTLVTLYPEIIGVLGERGVAMGGPPYTRYHSEDASTVDIEAGVPVREKVEGKGRVKATELPAGKTAVTWHVGPYDQLVKAHARLKEWIASKSLQSRGGLWEVYWTDPGIEPDPAKWRTRVFCPVQ